MNRQELDSIALHPSPEFEQFKELILAEEHKALNTLGRRVAVSNEPGELGPRLPEAIAKAEECRNQEFVGSLKTPVENAISLSVSTDRSRMASALFPILGPAIRLYVNELFRGLVDQLNESVKNATSLQRFKWRWEAKRAGLPYSEYVLLKTLNYQINEILLIDPNSGLLMQQVSRGTGSRLEENPELVSSMLVAIRSFARDTLSNPPIPGINAETVDNAELERFSYGDDEIFVETGPHAILAAVGSGTPPSAFRHQLTEVLENIHSRFNSEIREFSGDNTALEEARIEMQSLLIENKPSTSRKTSAWPFWTIAGAVALGLFSWGALSAYNEKMWNHALSALDSEPGLQVVKSQKTGWNSRTIDLLRDPAATAPMSLIRNTTPSLASNIEIKETPFLSSEVEFLIMRKHEQEDQQYRQISRALNDERSSRNNRIAALSESVESDLSARDLAEKKSTEKATRAIFDSHFKDLGASLEKVDGDWKVSGKAREPYYSQIIATVEKFIIDGAPVDLSGLERVTPPATELEFQRRCAQIEALPIVFESGKFKLTDEVLLSMETAAGVMRLLDLWCLEKGRTLPFYEIHAFPVTGVHEQPNHEVEAIRLERMTAFLESFGVGKSRLSTFHAPQRINDRIGLSIRVSPR